MGVRTLFRRLHLDCPRRLRPGEEERLTSQGHARTVFRRALEHGNLLVAEATARELGRVTLAEALELASDTASMCP
jgi:hypothetical protein